jgi:hypothetical protein
MIALVLMALTILKLAGAVGSLLVLVLLRRRLRAHGAPTQPTITTAQRVHSFSPVTGTATDMKVSL